MYHIKECIVVEGVYDKIKLSNIVDGAVFVTNGFAIFNRKKDIETLKTFAKNCGVVILTDSDAAGFKIRNYIKQALPKDRVKHAYIPEVKGKERRKEKAGKEGLLGVEGINDEILLNALKNAGCTIDGKESVNAREKITKTDLYMLGLSGGKDSAAMRRKLCNVLGLPGRISPNMLVDSVNAIMSKEQFYTIAKKLANNKNSIDNI